MLFLGVDGIKIKFNPFMGSTNYNGEISDTNLTIILFSGSIFNIGVASILFFISILIKSKNTLPLKFISFVAYFIEGGVALTTLTTSAIVTDWAGLMYFGLPPIIVLLVGILFISISASILFNIWANIDITYRSSFLKIITINMIFFIHNLFSFIIAITLMNTENSDIGQMLLNEFYLNVIIFIILIIIYKYIIPYLIKDMAIKENELTNNVVYLSLLSGFVMFLISLISSNVTWIIT